MNTIGQNIAYFRKQKNMTQEELAEKMSVTAQAISKWECDASYPDIITVQALSKVLGVSVTELFDGIQTPAEIKDAPQEVIDIIEKFTAVDEPKRDIKLSKEVADDLSLDEEGNVVLSDEYVIGKSAELFGEKIFETAEKVKDLFVKETPSYGTDDAVDKLKFMMHENAVKSIVDTAQSTYGTDMRASDKRQIETRLKAESDKMIDKTYSNYVIEKNVIEKERTEALQTRDVSGKTVVEINAEFDRKQEEAISDLQAKLSSVVEQFVKTSSEEVIKTVETNKKEREKRSSFYFKNNINSFSFPNFSISFKFFLLTIPLAFIKISLLKFLISLKQVLPIKKSLFCNPFTFSSTSTTCDWCGMNLTT